MRYSLYCCLLIIYCCLKYKIKWKLFLLSYFTQQDYLIDVLSISVVQYWFVDILENVASLLQECSDMIRGRERKILWIHLMLIKIGWFFQKPFAKNKNKNKVFLYWCCIEPYSSFIGLDKNFRNTWYLRVSKILLKFCGVCCDLWCFVKQRRRNGKKTN